MGQQKYNVEEKYIYVCLEHLFNKKQKGRCGLCSYFKTFPSLSFFIDLLLRLWKYGELTVPTF